MRTNSSADSTMPIGVAVSIQDVESEPCPMRRMRTRGAKRSESAIPWLVRNRFDAQTWPRPGAGTRARRGAVRSSSRASSAAS